MALTSVKSETWYRFKRYKKVKGEGLYNISLTFCSKQTTVISFLNENPVRQIALKMLLIRSTNTVIKNYY